MIATKRAYDPYDSADGFRVLVDRLWPRGVSKANAHIDLWAKEISPSNELRKWYSHDPDKWPEFQKRYAHELQSPEAAAVLDDLARRARRGRVTLVYSSAAGDISNAAALVQLLKRRAGRNTGRTGRSQTGRARGDGASAASATRRARTTSRSHATRRPAKRQRTRHG